MALVGMPGYLGMSGCFLELNRLIALLFKLVWVNLYAVKLKTQPCVCPYELPRQKRLHVVHMMCH